MDPKVLIVEDEPLIALDLENMIEDAGLTVAGIANNRERAFAVAPLADIALVDINLADGATGPEIGRVLAGRYGISVVFMTANPEMVADGVEGTFGVVNKPVARRLVEQALKYAIGRRNGEISAVPTGMTVFA